MSPAHVSLQPRREDTQVSWCQESPRTGLWVQAVTEAKLCAVVVDYIQPFNIDFSVEESLRGVA